MDLNSSGTWSAVTGQARSGSHSLAAGAVNDQDAYLVADGLTMTDLAFDAWWRIDNTDVDIAQGVRSSVSLPFNGYETNLEGSSGWDIAELSGGFWSEVLANQGTPDGYRWIKVTVISVGTQLKVLIDDVQLLPAAGYHDMGSQLTSGSVGFRIYRIPTGATWWIDDVRARKATDPEPSYQLGSEQCY